MTAFNTNVEHPMAIFTVEELLEVISAKLLATGDAQWMKRRIRRLCTDSRTVRPGDLFIALKGDRFDGHAFVETALRRGVAGAIVQESYRTTRSDRAPKRTDRKAPFLLGVPDPLFAYQQLASHHRCRFDVPMVAVTGSNGKTTTKEMVAGVLAQEKVVLKTEGNLNNRIGVPQTLLRLASRHQAAVIEMGVDREGQTIRLCEIARPTIGIITNIGPDHLEFFGSMEASAQAKAELLDLLPSDGVAVLNADDAYFAYLAARARCRVVSFGISSQADVRAADVRSDDRHGIRFKLILPGKARPTVVLLRAQGAYNVSNALAAAAVGHVLSLTGSQMAQGLARFRPAAMRSQVSMWNGVRIINDCYNANPASMKAAIQLLAQLGSSKRTIAVLGDMLELGPESHAMHREVGKFVTEQGVSELIACGALGRALAEGARSAGMAPDRVTEMPDALSAGAAAKGLVRRGDVVLVKASRGVRMEQVIEALTSARRVAKKAC
ncbi:MAG: UDP-N-acetylmuramoyl-tripeptide--D-alanyl-D-alanine ligase [Nitrospiraceae bacterium]